VDFCIISDVFALALFFVIDMQTAFLQRRRRRRRRRQEKIILF
jgi:hypothetical protein